MLKVNISNSWYLSFSSLLSFSKTFTEQTFDFSFVKKYNGLLPASFMYFFFLTDKSKQMLFVKIADGLIRT